MDGKCILFKLRDINTDEHVILKVTLEKVIIDIQKKVWIRIEPDASG